MSLRYAPSILMAWLAFVVLAGTAHAQQQPQRSRNPHGAIKVACENCHASESWTPIRRVPDFNHNRQTGYPLLGQHQDVPCTTCHINLVFTNISESCSSCHADIHRRQFGASCENCHTVRGWDVDVDAIQEHANRFPLAGAHAVAACESCHPGAASGAFVGLSTACVSCHMEDYTNAKSINHQQAGFGTNCETCHTLNRWETAKFDHNTQTRFVLMGAHTSVQCASCHVGGVFQGTPSDCFSCHVTDFNQTTDPDHRAAGFPTTCQSCHTETGWSGAAFDHSLSRFPLTGAHTAVACEQCHIGGQFTGTPQTCVSCHIQQFQATTAPNHTDAGFSQECASCHTTASWQGAQFDHNQTQFALTGAHTTVACSVCHVNNQFAGTSTDCYSCHSSDFAGTQNPNHVAAGFPTTCASCHTTQQWLGASFDHNTATSFPLTGAHVTVSCTSCHVGGVFAGTPQTCVSCHLTDFNATTNPNHVAAGFPQDCASCHTTQQWLGASFDHNTATSFPLTGAHVTVSCTSCHVGGVFAGTPQTCVSCHLTNFNATTNPNHASVGFTQDCAQCHSTTGWQPASFDHSQTAFPLTGAHTSLSCISCHSSGQTLSTGCVSCHLSNFTATTNPNHVDAGFPQDCTLCHTTTQWTGATFDHNNTAFPLTGAHTTTQCASCHIGGVYTGTPTACYSCHSTEYMSVTDPNHVAAGFPTTCATCHTTTTWTGATFTHTSFPIYSGAHAGQWSSCNVCHTNSSNYTVFSCLNCHAHEKTTTDEHHQAVSGYVYDSFSCYGCHPNGTH